MGDDIKYPEEVKQEVIERILHLYYLDSLAPKELLRSEHRISDNDTGESELSFSEEDLLELIEAMPQSKPIVRLD